MRLDKNFVIKRFGRNIIAFTVSSRRVEKIIQLNPTAEFICRMLKNDCSKQDIVERLSREYSIDADRAAEDVSVFIESLRRHDLLVV